MGNPWNPEAGDTPAPADARDRELVERSARVIWRAFPYVAWRYGERGRSFGRSDAGYLITLLTLDESVARQQVAWLAGVLAPRGMPSLLLEYQLESLGRMWRRDRTRGENRFVVLGAELRASRLSVLDAPVFDACERLCWSAALGVARRRGAGRLIAGAVADAALGLGEHDEALVGWFADAANDDPAWSNACAAARELALTRRRRAGGAGH